MRRRLGRVPDFHVRERIRDTDNLILLLIGLGIGLGLWFVLPQVLPRVRTGADCTSLAAPAGGNQRSILALAGDDSQRLEVEVRLSNSAMIQGEDLQITVSLINSDAGSIILYIPEFQDRAVLSTGGQRPGINVRIENIQTLQSVYVVAPDPITTLGSFSTNNLFLLPAHERCSMTFQFNSAELGNFGFPGEYRAQGLYINSNPGAQPALPGGVAPTATAMFATQGVWADQVASSEQVLFTISQPPPPTTAPVQ